MGQRLQVYIRMHNPVHALRNKLKYLKKCDAGQDRIVQLNQQIEKYKESFGNGPTTILAYHHQISRNGYESFHFLNFSEPSIRENFLLGDNNDGIIVIDTIRKGCCFMNIGTGDSTISQLPSLQPLNAEQYVRVYYPQSNEDSKTARLPENSSDNDAFYTNNTRINRLFLKSFKQYRLLDKGEVKKMFPLCFKELKTNSNDHV